MSKLDDIFARLEPREAEQNDLGRIDDDTGSPQPRLGYLSAAVNESPRTAWNRVWR